MLLQQHLMKVLSCCCYLDLGWSWPLLCCLKACICCHTTFKPNNEETRDGSSLCRHASLSVENAIQHKPASNGTRRFVNPGQAILAVDVAPQLVTCGTGFGPEMKLSFEAQLCEFHCQPIISSSLIISMSFPLSLTLTLCSPVAPRKHPLKQEILRRAQLKDLK